MKLPTIYQQCKIALKAYAQNIIKKAPKNKPLCRQEIDDCCARLCKGILKKEFDKIRLQNYACKLHPKDQTQFQFEFDK